MTVSISLFRIHNAKQESTQSPQSFSSQKSPITLNINRSAASTSGLVPSTLSSSAPQNSNSIDRRIAENSIQKVREYKERAAQQTQNTPESRKLKFDGREFFWRPDLMAVLSKDYQGNPGDRVGHLTHYTFLKRTDIQSSEIVIENTSELPVTENPNNHRLGVITGTIIIQINPETELDALASKHDMRIKSSVPHLHLAFLESKPRIDLRTQLLDLQNDPLISSAELEILDSQVIPK